MRTSEVPASASTMCPLSAPGIRLVLSHADNDHACGLVGVLEKSDVKNLWMNRPWLYAPQIIDQFHGN